MNIHWTEIQCDNCFKWTYHDCDRNCDKKRCLSFISHEWCFHFQETYSLFGNIIKPHRFLRMNALCEIENITGDGKSAYVRSALSRGGRRVRDFYVPLKFLGNFRIKYSYSKEKEQYGKR